MTIKYLPVIVATVQYIDWHDLDIGAADAQTRSKCTTSMVQMLGVGLDFGALFSHVFRPRASHSQSNNVLDVRRLINEQGVLTDPVDIDRLQ